MRAGTAIIAAIVLLAGCAEGGAAPPAPAPAPAPQLPVAVTLSQSRAFASRRMLQVRLRNDGDQPVGIQRFDLRPGRFAGTGPVARDTELAPGRELYVPLPYGAVRCGDDAPGPVLALRARLGDGAPGDAELRLAAPDPLLERLAARECAQLAVQEEAEIAFAGTWSLDGGVARGTLVLARRGSGGPPVTVTQAGSNVLYTLRTVPAPPAVLAGGAALLELPVEVTLGRCEAHALIEAKLRHQFPLWVALGDGEPASLTVEVGDEGRAVLDDLLARCLAGA